LVVVMALSLALPACGTGSEASGSRAGPDIVYVIMDRYASAWTLEELYGFDNRPFLRSLRRRGFFVAQESLANYPKTAHSMAASLNMRYLGFLQEEGHDPADWGPAWEMLESTETSRFLQEQGYEYVHVGSWWGPTSEDSAADVNIRYEGPPYPHDRRALADWILSQFETIPAAVQREGPTFVVAHFLFPHPPYVFDQEGRFVSLQEEMSKSRDTAYLAQLQFANQKLEELVDRLLAPGRGSRPIIVLQSDEGPHPIEYEYNSLFDWTGASLDQLREKLTILNAYYLPGAGPQPYPTITPVNSFRLIFDRYFDAGLGLLPDRVYIFKDERHLYRYWDVTDRVRQEPAAA
jgi:Sulfatase